MALRQVSLSLPKSNLRLTFMAAPIRVERFVQSIVYRENHLRIVFGEFTRLEPGCPAQHRASFGARRQHTTRHLCGLESQTKIEIKLHPRQEPGKINQRFERRASGQ